MRVAIMALLVLAGCDDKDLIDDPPPRNPTPDAPSQLDAGMDAARDGATDSTPDVAPDMAPDITPDLPDAGHDAQRGPSPLPRLRRGSPRPPQRTRRFSLLRLEPLPAALAA